MDAPNSGLPAANERPPSGQLEQVEPGIGRVLADNPSPFTFTGTQSYLVGERDLIVVDPGPDLPGHVAALVTAIAGRRVVAIACTHTHRDHSPASRALKAVTGAPIIGCAALPPGSGGPGTEGSFDGDYAPDGVLGDGEALLLDEEPFTAVATPGHTSNHLCFAWRDVLFSGDHVMGWSTSVVIPPDGDMGAYRASLDKLRGRDDRVYYPGHGPAVTNPQQLVRGMIGHRLQRERQILRALGEGERSVAAIVATGYPALDPRLVPAAGASVLAHLIELERRGSVARVGDSEWRMLTAAA